MPRTTVERLDIKLTNAEIFAQLMVANGYTVRTLAEAVQRELIKKHSKTTVHPATIGHLRSGHRNTVKHDVAEAIAELFGMPTAAIFTPKLITVTKQTPGRKPKE